MQPEPSWSPTATLENLHARAEFLSLIRAFFAARKILEVETPLLCHSSTPDPYIASIPVNVDFGASIPETFFLQTSPEFAMKRLLAAGIGPIYQICKAFRGGERGSRHNPEFTMLEWYRPEFSHHDLMDEVNEFLEVTLNTLPAERFSYAEIFANYLDINPHAASVANLRDCAEKHGICEIVGMEKASKDDWLNLLMSHCIEPQLGLIKPVFIYDYPSTQAALARIREDKFSVAERFELYINGIELANGFHELRDAAEQRMRFLKDLETRREKGLPLIPVDENFLSALESGFPNCAGVALGIDRLLMFKTKARDIAEVLSFTVENA